jgi:multicomponent Na+:H+ antiporter subunit E
MEEISWQNVAIGMFMSMLCMHFFGKFMNFKEIENVNFYKLALFPLWLVYRIYADALFMLKMIISNAKWGFIEDETTLENESLRIFLADSITLTPGSIFIEMKDKTLKLLAIGSRKTPGFPVATGGLRAIENILSKSQRKSV